MAVTAPASVFVDLYFTDVQQIKFPILVKTLAEDSPYEKRKVATVCILQTSSLLLLSVFQV